MTYLASDAESAPSRTAETRLQHFERRFEMAGRSLSVPMAVFPDETFLNLVVRAAADNGFTNTRTVVDLLASNSPSVSSFRSTFRDTWVTREVLADTFGIPREQTLPPLERTARRGYQTFFGSVVRNKWVISYRRFSPLALRGALYDRALWSLLPFSFDPGSRQILIDNCPVCGNRMRHKFTVGVQYCDACAIKAGPYSRPSYDLRDAESPFVEVDDEAGLELAIRLVDPNCNTRDIALDGLHPELSGASRSGLFEFLVIIGTCLTIHGNVAGTIAESSMHRSNLAPLSPQALAEAGGMILDWPNRFEDFIGYVRRRKGLRNHPLYTQFLTSTIEPDLARMVHGLIRRERAGAITKVAFARAVAQPSPYEAVSFTDAVAALGRRGPKREFNLLFEFANRDDVAVSKAQVKQTAMSHRRGMTPLAKTLGVPIYGLVDLVCRDLLPPDLLDIEPNLKDVANYADDLLADVRAKAVPTKPPAETFSLGAVMNALSLRTVPPWADLLCAAARGEFEFWLQRYRSSELFKCIRVRDLDAVRKIIATAAEAEADLAQLCVTTLDAALTLGIAKSQMWDYKTAGLIKSAMTLQDVMHVRTEHLFVCELVPRMALCGVKRSAWSIAYELRKERILPIGPPPLTLRKRMAVETHFGASLWPCYRDPAPISETAVSKSKGGSR